MAAVMEHPALERLAALERRLSDGPAMGYQSSLDGVRAMSVIAVIFYHAGFGWMHGGFFGVEVFFVVSGFLITSLLIEERDRDGRVSLGQFWRRRWRRLLPALFTMMIAVGVWAVFWGTAEQNSQLRRDYPWGIFYAANWGQIMGEVAYFSPSPGLLRHLWSLAVEEQWYLLWPLLFIAITRGRASDRRRGRAVMTAAVVVMALTAILAVGSQLTPERTNLLYLSTITRSSGLLLGAGMAFVWRPWQITARPQSNAGAVLDRAGFAAVGVLLFAFVSGAVVERATYLWMLPMVTVASAVLVAVVVHPWAWQNRVVFGSRAMVEIGKRSYGLYLWSWPISRACAAFSGSVGRFLLAMAITVPVSELCYRFVETPIRRGALGRWWAAPRDRNGNVRLAGAAVSGVVLLGSLGLYFQRTAATFDVAKDFDNEVVFDLDALQVAEPATTVGAAVAPQTTVAASVASLPRRVVIVGDSTAHSLAVNLPVGIGDTFKIADGSLQGCSIYDSGTAVSARDGYSRSFGECKGWEQKWVKAARKIDAELALVVTGAWDVFDIEIDGETLVFDTPPNDAWFKAGVQSGIDALAAVGVKSALLEVPCMRPQDVKGAGVPALPERGDDARVAHLNELLREVAADNPTTAVFVAGAPEWCTDEAIATDLEYRWDGVHAYAPGAKLTYEAIARSLLAIPMP